MDTEEYNQDNDLFYHYDKQPKNLQLITDKWAKKWDTGDGYKNCRAFLKEVEKIGYTFEYYLDAEPYNLHLKLNKP